MAHFAIPTHVVIGSEALKEASTYLKEYGNKALIVTGPHVSKSPMMQELKKCLESIEIGYFVFDEITGEPTDKMIEKGVEAYRKSNSRFVIGIGGGSPLDSAKAIAVMSVQKDGCRISDYMGVEITGPIPKIVAIPTTSGTGSEATKFTVITDTERNIKMLLKGNCLIPDLAILNYEYTMDMPKSVTASTGLDALTHAIEAYTSKLANPLTDVFGLSAVKRIMKYLPIAYKNGHDSVAREQMSIAAFEAGVCINNSSVTLVHGMSRPIGALFHVPHGKSNAMLLECCLRFALDGTYSRFSDLGRVCGCATGDDSDQVAAEKFIEAVRQVLIACEIPTLREYGIHRDDFIAAIPKMAEDAIASKSPSNTRKEVTEKDCEMLYHQLIRM
ncbi:iron-containing alcohol dehydrogenase [Agathobacter ruminis]|uniref:Alcohol dehydrogenase n=1 Tax=Agathobacter ruminis TaxID=1712665 RepID=A0A2G3E5D3_9FIRM|nr:iron-containing alcohol dehydrogenase [Agathobacter ruminis]MDC7301148.1 iron-containing alcohol dehydrogenase [Agathobacter ruminis]PHU38365.1 alcohol dehydrogenase [Agathobacter ruminis]